MARRLSVVVSQGQSQNPVKRQLEEEVVAGLIMENGIDVAVIRHLYDLTSDDTSVLALQGISGDLVVVSWLYERAARWVLNRWNVQGHEGTSLLTTNDDEEDEEEEGPDPEADADHEDRPRVADTWEVPKRQIYCLDLRAAASADAFVEEIRRIAGEVSTDTVELQSWVGGNPKPEALERFHQPTNNTALGEPNRAASPAPPDAVPDRRWYPVIDFSRCTNCMECIDFCLFGVYGVDAAETILVEQPDNCRKGCPACSRVCPENAIMFPQHKTPAIAGAPVTVDSLKIDLSKLFGAPDAIGVAAAERDEQLVLAGREAVGLSVGVPKRQADRPAEPRDELDDLIDGLDDLDG